MGRRHARHLPETTIPGDPRCRRVRTLQYRRLCRAGHSTRHSPRRLQGGPDRPPAADAVWQDRDLLEGALRHGTPGRDPGLPKYIEEWESPFGPEAERYPLQVIGSHGLHRVHSTHENTDWLDEAFPQRVFINRVDAEDRGVGDGDLVRVFNDRGSIVMPCRITPRIMPGVVDIPEGAWWTPDENGTDRRGCVNVLTSERLTPLAFGNAQHTIMVEIEGAGKG